MTNLSDIFVVSKRGVYFHGVYGVSESLTRAEVLAQTAAKNDIDSHHSWGVYRIRPDRLAVTDWGWMGTPVASFKFADTEAGWIREQVYQT